MAEKVDLKNQFPTFHGIDHIYSFPVYKKEIVFDDNGDQHEEFVPLSRDEMRLHRSMSLLGDVLNGTQVVDTSHLDKFQLMDALEQMIDDMPQETIDNILGKKHE